VFLLAEGPAIAAAVAAAQETHLVLGVTKSAVQRKLLIGYTDAPNKISSKKRMHALGAGQSETLRYDNLFHLEKGSMSKERMKQAAQFGVLMKSGEGHGSAIFAPGACVVSLRDGGSSRQRNAAQSYAKAHLSLGAWATDALGGAAAGEWDKHPWTAVFATGKILSLGIFAQSGLSAEQHTMIANHRIADEAGRAPMKKSKTRK
jgi:hypothetical protein